MVEQGSGKATPLADQILALCHSLRGDVATAEPFLTRLIDAANTALDRGGDASGALFPDGRTVGLHHSAGAQHLEEDVVPPLVLGDDVGV